ncbi:MAG: GNAT family N-acetyltransferase [Saprospiraceae bacterium]|nr:GNAT family N-acetyltransferase [Saprospiraceae bacterium]
MTIRKAKTKDLPGILRLVHELAEYELAADQVTATIDDYQKAFQDNVFDALVAVDKDGKITGTCIFCITWSTWKGKMLYLEDFVVDRHLRQSGIGQKLFDATINHAKKLHCALIKWQVLDWNRPALKFYEKNKAVIEKEWWNGKIYL